MVRVNDDYIIEVDQLNYTVKRDLHKERISEDKITGEAVSIPMYSLVGFFGDLGQAIWGIVRDMNRYDLANGEHDLKEALKIIKSNNKKFMDLLNRVLGEDV